MKKKLLLGIFALAFLLIAGYGMNRSMKSYAGLSELALKNVVALADMEEPDPGEDGPSNLEAECRELPMGIWNEALHCDDGGATTVECTIEGQLNFAGKVINGNYKVGVKYPVLWERWKCDLSTGNCCDGSKQGTDWA
jgi:hypothetical protein